MSSLFFFFLAALLGFASNYLRSRTNSTLLSRLESLSSAPTIPLSSLKTPNSKHSALILLQNGVVSPLSHPLFASSRRYAVLLKNGLDNSVSAVPFALSENIHGSRPRVAVVNAGERHFVMELDSCSSDRFLGVGTRIENVFGRLRCSGGDGMLEVEIEPCPLFPAKCFTMSRSEIEEKLRSDACLWLRFSIAIGVASAGFLVCGIYLYRM